ncbi:MAG TPA: asparagine synthase (glutamine-hydrolyzing) [Steroidobacteraceae bacterium]|nr:asparagine synthase (glutamine-hydrolyzing) [Steroidobacteraceae bacterium]
MCGIAGILSLPGAKPVEKRELAAMIGTLHHRGPDGYGFLEDPVCGLAHARLAIIDLSSGDQPIHNEDKTVWTVFNGEIFNYIELRKELEARGHRFYTHSDTEVIVHAYEEYGDRYVDHLNGQFAIAIWDVKQRRLSLSRDRTGIRPLYYAQVGNRLAFGSEVKALLALPEMPRALDPRGLAEVFSYWSTAGEQTVFAGVKQLPPGHQMTVDARGTRIAQYWDWEFPDAPIIATRPAEDYAEELRALLIDAVRLQLRADVPVGAYLSGGLDSSLITGLIKHYTDTPLRTFSVTFDDGEFDESAHQQEMVSHLGTNHSSTLCRAADIADAFAKVVWHAESPVLRTAPAPLMLLSKLVRESGYKVVLTGEGADEVFGGYDLFKEAKIRRFWARNPQSKFRHKLLDKLYPYLRNSPSAAGGFAQKFFGEGLDQQARAGFAHGPRWTTTQRTWQFFSPAMKQAIGAFDPATAYEATMPAGAARWPPIARDQYVESHTLLSGYLLSSQGDRMGMANSIEGRFPFLDHRVVEFANKLPPHLKIRGLTEKYLLKKAAYGVVADNIRKRTKQPYRAPDSASFFANGAAHESVATLLADSRVAAAGYFEPRAVSRLVEKCRAGRAIGFADNMAFVGVLSTMMLHESFIARAHEPVPEAVTASAGLRTATTA